MRERWFDAVYAKFATYTYKLPKGIIDSSDLHVRNIAFYYFSKPLKVHSETLNNDSNVTAECDPVYRLIFSGIVDQTFWRYALRSPDWHNAKRCLNEIQETTAERGLGMSELTEWWREWIKKRQELAHGNEACLKALKKLENKFSNKGTLFKQSLVDNKKMNPQLLKLMLYDMGICTP